MGLNRAFAASDGEASFCLSCSSSSCNSAVIEGSAAVSVAKLPRSRKMSCKDCLDANRSDVGDNLIVSRRAILGKVESFHN